jgi:hypothetical protein
MENRVLKSTIESGWRGRVIAHSRPRGERNLVQACVAVANLNRVGSRMVVP